MKLGHSTFALTGILEDEPEIKTTLAGKTLANFTIKQENRGGVIALFAVSAYGPVAEQLTKLTQRGDYISVLGHLQVTGREGRTGFLNLIADHFDVPDYEAPEHDPNEGRGWNAKITIPQPITVIPDTDPFTD